MLCINYQLSTGETRVCPTAPAGAGDGSVACSCGHTRTLTRGLWPSEGILHGLHPVQGAHVHRAVQHLAEDCHAGVVVERDGGRGGQAEDAHLHNKKKKGQRNKEPFFFLRMRDAGPQCRLSLADYL